VYANGKWLTPDITSHFAYFYNTLNCAMSVMDPFRNVRDFPALEFRSESTFSLESPDKRDLKMVNQLSITSNDSVPKKLSVIDKHRSVIFPQYAGRISSKPSTN